jgi:hypothetical protein
MIENKKYWTKLVSKILKVELAKQAISYAQLVEKLESIGVKVKISDIRVRLSQGTFSARFLIQCLKAIGVKNLSLEEIVFEAHSSDFDITV